MHVVGTAQTLDGGDGVAFMHDGERLRQELMRRPSAITVQAPHWPWSQPFLVPVRCRCSRNASSSVVRVSTATSRRRPLTLKKTFATASVRTGVCDNTAGACAFDSRGAAPMAA